MNNIEPPALLAINLNRLIINYKSFSQAFPGVLVAYAVKANPHPTILKTLFQQGANFESSSYAEIKTLLQLNIPPDKIIFSNPVKSKNAIQEAVFKGIIHYTIDSIQELSKFQDYHSQVKLHLRIYVPNNGALWPLNHKFGCEEPYWQVIFDYVKKYQLSLVGLSFHVGSQCETIQTWQKAMNYTYRCLKLGYKNGIYLDTLNIGGGFPIQLNNKVPTVEQIAKVIYDNIQKWKKYDKHISIQNIIAEPGRFIIGSAGVLKANIIGVTIRKKIPWVFLNTGLFSGMMETMEGIQYPIITNAEGKLYKQVLCGPTCDALDKLYTVKLPIMDVHHNIYFMGTGAYSSVYASEFNGFRGPHVFFTKQDINLSCLEHAERLFQDIVFS